MNTAWVLFFIFSPLHSYSVSFTVENLASSAECERVAGVLKDQRYFSTSFHRCVEVVKKGGV